jgi:signal peptidase
MSALVGSRTNRRIRRHVVVGLRSTVCLALFVAAAWCLWPARWGGTFAEVVVSGHSMEPTYHTGDLVVTERSDHYRIGDKVVYTIPKGEPGAGIDVVHRIVDFRPDGTLVLQGDNRVTPDDWRPTTHDVVGRVVAMVPVAGLLLVWLSRPLVLAVMAGLIITAWLWPDRDVTRTDGNRADERDTEEIVVVPAYAMAQEHLAFSSPNRERWWADEDLHRGPWWADEVASLMLAHVVLDQSCDLREPVCTL